MKNNITEHPSTILRREIDAMKKKLDSLERSMHTTEKVILELIQKQNIMKEQIIKLLDEVSKLGAKRKKRVTKPT